MKYYKNKNNSNNSDNDYDDQLNNNNNDNTNNKYLKKNNNKKDKDNNNKHHKNKNNNNDFQNYNSLNNNQKRNNNNSNSSNNNSNNISSSNEEDKNYNSLNNNLFYKIWRNKYLKSKILHMIKLYNIHQYTRKFESLELLFSHKYSDYIEKVEFQIDLDGTNILERLSKSNLCIRKVKLIGDYNHDINLSVSSASGTASSETGRALTISDVSAASESLAALTVSLPEISTSTLTSLEILNFTKDNLNLVSLNGLKRFKFENLNLQFDYSQFKSVLSKSSIENLILNSFNFNQESMDEILPNSLKKFKVVNTIKECINQDFIFPSTLTYLDITINELDVLLPDSLRVLKLSAYKVKEDCIPSTLEHLTIDTWSLNHKIIPQKNLKSLEIGGLFDKSLIDSYGVSIIPKSLKSLTFSSLHIIGRPSRPGFNQTIGKKEFNNCRRLKYLKFNCDFDQQLLPNVLPENLTSLSFTEFNNGGLQMIEKNLFPGSLTSLDLGLRFNQKIGVDTLPKTGRLKRLCMGEYYNQKFQDKSLPDSILEFELLNQDFRHPIPINFSKTSIKCNYNLKKIKSLAPETLTSIKLYKCKRNQDEELNIINNNGINNNTNNNESSSNISNNINNNDSSTNNNNKTPPLKNKKELKHLEFDNSFSDELLIANLPKDNNIKVLVLGSSFNNQINLEDFKNLEQLVVYGNPTINPISTTITNSNNETMYQYNFSNLKCIKTPVNNINFLNNLNEIFYSFIILLNKIK